jgi:PAS domain S-box-containing protein
MLKHSEPKLAFGLFIGGTAVAYLAVLILSLLAFEYTDGLFAIWPASGAALGILLLNDPRRWRALLLTFFVANLFAFVIFDFSLPAALGLALVRALEPALAAWVLMRWSGKPVVFSRTRHFIGLWFTATVVNAVTTLLGMVVLVLALGQVYPITWLTWWVSSGASMVIVTPLLVAWASNPPSMKAVPLKRALEAALFAVSLFGTAWFAFGQDYSYSEPQPRPYLLYPLLGWAALRFGIRGTVTALTGLAIMVVTVTAAGIGNTPFGGINAGERLYAVQIYLSVVTIFISLMAAVFNERVQAESALSKSLQRLAGHMDNSPLGIVELDGQQRIMRWSREAERVFGWSPAEVTGKRFDSFRWVCEEDFEMVGREMEGLANGTRPSSTIVNRNYRKDGTVVHCEWYNSGIYDPQGKLISILSQVLDITERVQVEKISSARLRIANFAISHSLDEVLQYVLDEIEFATGSCIGFFHFLGRDQETLWLQNWSTRTVKEFCTAEGKGSHYPVRHAGIWADCVRQRRVVVHNDYAHELARKGLPPGHAVVLRELVVPVFRGEQIVAILGVGNKPRHYDEKDIELASRLADLSWDVAERKRVEKDLKESELRYRIVADNTYDWEFWQNPQDEFIYNSPSCKQITGYEADDFVRDPGLLDAIVYPEDREIYLEHANRAKEEKQPGGIDFRIVKKDGEIRWISHLCQPVYDNDGQYRGIRGNNRDMTQNKNDEIALRQSLSEKEMLMRELQHRTKNNLNVVISLLQLGQNSLEDQHAQEVLSEVQSRIFSMVAIYDQLYRKGMVDQIELGKYIQNLTSELAASYLPQSGRIKMDVQVEDLVLDLKRAVPIGLILNELVINALKYAFPGDASGSIQICLKRQDGMVELTVVDDGVGIDVKRVTPNGSGTGLKLVRILAKQINANFKLNTIKGTSASITLFESPPPNGKV